MIETRDIMTTNVVFIDPEANVEDAIELMLRHGISGLPVVACCGQLLGVITEYDILDMIDDPHTERNEVFHYMTRDLEVVDVGTTLTDLAQRFRQRSIRRYPVVEEGRLVGIVSRRELIRFVHDVRITLRDRLHAATA